MAQLVASITIALLLVVLVLRDVLVDHGRLVRATWSEHDEGRRVDDLGVDALGDDDALRSGDEAAA